MLSKLTHVEPKQNYTLQVSFQDGTSGLIDVSKYAAYFKNNERSFDQVNIIDDNVYRDEDFDMSADAMYIQLTWKNPFIS